MYMHNNHCQRVTAHLLLNILYIIIIIIIIIIFSKYHYNVEVNVNKIFKAEEY
jgi:hypothetical protein